MNNRTIAAISTPQGTGGIAVIRISGMEATYIADKVFSGKKLSEVPTHTVHYGFIKNKKGEIIDEVLATVMLAPKTFTCENTVEISCHGGYASTKAVLETVIEAGAYMAEPGEFTKRAFMNGRIDLSQAEAIIDVINAKNDMSRRNAVSQLGGSLSKEIKNVRDRLVHLQAEMQVIIDYPDEDLEDVTAQDIAEECISCGREVKHLLDTSDSGRMICDGIRAAIVGKPNVGKSSILNSLARDERAIVTDIAGTTRDVIEENVNINGVPLILSDTAGIRDTDDMVEKIGVEKSKQYIDSADIVLVVLDASNTFADGDKEVLEATKDKKKIIIFNKTDIAADELMYSPSENEAVVSVSAKTGKGMADLASAIEKLCKLNEINSQNGAVITNMRHKSALINAYEALVRASNAIFAGMPTDIASIDIMGAISALGEITGETVSESVVNDIFHNFCVGK